MSICQWSLGAFRNIIAASKIRRRFLQVSCPSKFRSFLLLFVEFHQNFLITFAQYCMKLNWNFLGGGRVQNKKPSIGGGGGGESMNNFLELCMITNIFDVAHIMVSCRKR